MSAAERPYVPRPERLAFEASKSPEDFLRWMNAYANENGGDGELHALCSWAHGLLPKIGGLAATVERQREALELLSDNAEAYLDLEQDGARNYPESLRLCVADARAALAGEPPQDREGKSGADTSEGALTPAVAVPSRSIIAAPPGALTREGLAASTSASPNSATVVDPPEAAE